MPGLFGCDKKETDIVLEKFRTQIKSQGLKIDSIDNEGLIHISKGGIDLKVSLDNLRKNHEREQDDSLIIDFVEVIFSQLEPLPAWEKARNKIFVSLFPSDFDFQNFLNKRITDDFNRIFMHVENNKLSWISKDDLAEWGISEQELEKAALENGRIELNKATLQIDTIENHKLGFIETERESLKAGLLFSPNLMEKVKDELDWPIYAVIPVRDFCYLFSEKDFDFFSGRLGKTVVQEYKESGYPVTTEILKFTDKGIEAVRKHPVE